MLFRQIDPTHISQLHHVLRNNRFIAQQRILRILTFCKMAGKGDSGMIEIDGGALEGVSSQI